MDNGPAIELDGGLLLRSGRPHDRDAILALTEATLGDSENGAVTYLLGRPEAWTVVVDGDRVVSTCVLLEHAARYETVPFALGQIEYVATDPAYRRRGLVRAQFDAAHRRSAELGQLMTLVTGIPYFYRRLGYQYGLQYPERYRLVDRTLATTDPWTVDAAGPDDVDDLVRLHTADHAAAGFVTLRPRADWEWLVRKAGGHGEEVFVARRDGRVEGFGRLQRHPEAVVARTELYEAAADSIGAARALLVHARGGDGGADLAIIDRPGTPFSAALHSAGERSQDYLAIYTRIPDPVAFLGHIRPALSARLAASSFVAATGPLVLSLYDRSIVLPYDEGEVGVATWGPAMEDPYEEGHSGIAADALDALLLGRMGARALEARVDDAMLAHDLPLLDVLFPRMNTDLPMTV